MGRLVQRPASLHGHRERAFINRGRGLHAETAQSALTIIWKLVKGGLISVFLIIITTVTLQLQSQFVPVSLRPDLGSLEVSVTAAV